MSQPSLLPAVTIVDGTPRVSSLHIAEHFGKRHTNALRLIKTIMTDLPEDFTRLNFELSEYTDETGRKLPCYSLTRDAFVLVVMGFTGKAALAWKVRYIEAFNQMEKALTGQAAIPSSQKIALPKSFYVSIIKGRPSTSTMAVASVFGKNDDDVMRDVQAIMANSPKEFNEHNFRFISAPMIDEPDLTFYILTREAFMLLTRDYTGKKAMQVKVACIEAFKTAEARLAEQKALPQAALPAKKAPIDELRARIDKLRCFARAERDSIAMDLMSFLTDGDMGASGFRQYDTLRVPVHMMLEEIIGTGTDAAFKYNNPCDFVIRMKELFKTQPQQQIR